MSAGTLSQDLGLVGARVEISGTIRQFDHRFTAYGTTTEIIFVTSAGTRVRWNASHHMELTVGADLTVKATIKAYNEDATADVVVTRGVVCDAPSTLF